MIDNKTREIFSEIDAFLKIVGDTYKNKIPNKLIKLIQEQKSTEYNPQYNPEIPIEEQNLKKETLAMIALLDLNYWCETDQEKDELKTILAENENLEKKELMEKYNPNNIFKNSSFSEQAYSKEFIADNETKNNLPVDVSLSPWYSNIIRKIREFFSKFAKKNN